MDRKSNLLCCILHRLTGTALAPTLGAQHCPTSLAYTWNLLFPTKLPPILQNQNRKMCRKLSAQLGFQQIHFRQIHIQTASSSLALTLESSNWEVPKPVRLICPNITNFGKKWKKYAYPHLWLHLLSHPLGRWGGEGVPHSYEHHTAEI